LLSLSFPRKRHESEHALSHFFFHLSTPVGLEHDEDGLTLEDLDTAYLKACAAIPDMTADFLRQGVDSASYVFVIANAEDETLMEVPFTERLPQRRPVRQDCSKEARRLFGEIADTIREARETMRRSREILARSRAAY
jgi:hypothetical protein